MSKKHVVLTSLAFTLSLVCLPALSQAQPGGGGFRGRPGGSGGGTMWLLNDESVRKELEIVDSQAEKLTELRDSFMAEMRETFSGLRDLSQEERQAKFAELRETMEEKRAALEKQIAGELLPHQVSRLKQIALQSRLRSRGTSGALSDGALAEELGITDEQKEKLTAAAEKARQKMNEKIATARKEARDEILKALTPAQRAKLEELLGDDFEFQRQTFGRGGAGGQRRGGGGPRGE